MQIGMPTQRTSATSTPMPHQAPQPLVNGVGMPGAPVAGHHMPGAMPHPGATTQRGPYPGVGGMPSAIGQMGPQQHLPGHNIPAAPMNPLAATVSNPQNVYNKFMQVN